MGELARAGLGEIHAVISAQLADLAFEVGALLQVAAGFVSGLSPASVVPSGLVPGLVSEGFASGLARASFLSPFLSAGLSDLSAAGSRKETRSLRPSMTTMASAFSVARMPLAAAAQSAGSPLG